MNIQHTLLTFVNYRNGIDYLELKGEKSYQSYRELLEDAQGIAGGLQKDGLQPQDIVVLQLAGIRNMVTLYWACIYSGIIPANIGLVTDEKGMAYLQKIVSQLQTDGRNVLVITDREHILNAFEKNVKSYIDLDVSEKGKFCEQEESKTGMLQYTSGTTSQPKAAMLTYSNIYEGALASSIVVRKNTTEKYVSWLPLSHIFGLVGYHLVPVFNDFPQYQIHPNQFVTKPLKWIEILSDYKATLSGTTLFGLGLVLKNKGKIKKDWDLSSMYIVFCGGEDVEASMINSFEKELSAVNWQPHVIRPAYGLSETTMGVSYTPTGVPFKVDYLIGNEFGIGKKVRCYDKKQEKKGIERVSVGVLDECNDVEIRDYEDNTLTEETIGLINIRGSNVMKGYFNWDNTGIIDNDGWFNTGDLGYFHKGWLTVLGREKNVIIFNGKNYLVTDLEHTGKKHLSPKDAIVLIQGYTVNKQKTCILFGEGLSENQLLVSARDIMDEWGIKISFVVVLDQIPRTSSGKVNRIQLSTDWEQKTYDDKIIKVKSQEQSKGTIDPKLIGIWAEILAIEPSGIGKDSHFITDLGGDSLGVIDMTCEVEEVYSLSIPETEVENLLVLEAMNDFIKKKIS